MCWEVVMCIIPWRWTSQNSTSLKISTSKLVRWRFIEGLVWMKSYSICGSPQKHSAKLNR
nr:hypothetical protein 1 [Actinidia virus 1]